MNKKFKFTRPTVESVAPSEADIKVWDTVVRGFGMKITPRGKRVYILIYRFGGRVRWYTIGEHGSPWTPDTARDEALRLLGEVVSKRDPAKTRKVERSSATLSELCDLYLKEGCATKKPSTLATDRGRIERHIKPLLGNRRAAEVSKADVEKFLVDLAEGKTKADIKTGKRGRAIVRGGRGTATRTVGLLGAIFSFAVERGIRDTNPTTGIKKYPDRKVVRYLAPDEWSALGRSMKAYEKHGNDVAVNAIRLLALTGCRKSEILTLKWSNVDCQTGYFYLSDSKTGPKAVPIGAAAIAFFSTLPRLKDNEFVFPGAKPGAHIVGVPKIWDKIKRDAGLDDVRLHDLRHSFASTGVSSGMGLPIIGAILGQRNASTTQRYAHLADTPVRKAANEISRQITGAMNGCKASKNKAQRAVPKGKPS